jgi:A/G-specific adenine glycosylase
MSVPLPPLQSEILAWYEQHQRALPWRGESDPYKIWVSEVMLQQTQVATVIPYYARFLAEFPSVQVLASAPLKAVLKAWEGLGYYARARNLHQAAQQVMADYNSSLPETYAELRKLPGFGEYTAGAVASIAFGQAVPAVNGNVKRVISRLYAIESDITRQAGRNQIRERATALAETAPKPGIWTQALMELGATICLPKQPRCLLCPAGQGLCQAQQKGLAESLPVKPQRKATPHYNVAAGIIYRDERKNEFLIAQRPLDGLLGGLWEFPGGKQQPGESLSACLKREIKEELALDINVGAAVTQVKHAFTHFKITLHAFEAQVDFASRPPQKIEVADWAWVTLADLPGYAFGRADRKVIAVLQARAAELG